MQEPLDFELAFALGHQLNLRGDPPALALVERVRKRNAPQDVSFNTVVDFPLQWLEIDPIVQGLVALAYGHQRRRIRQAAARLLEYASQRRGMSRVQFEDALTPTGGISGAALIDYGNRQFRMRLGDHHTPLLVGDQRRAHTALPRTRAGRQAQLAAGKVWRTHKSLLKWTSRVQTKRLEYAMINRVRWRNAEFQALLNHQLLSELARRVIWVGYDADGRRGEVFCLADHLSPVGMEYQPVALDRYAAFGIPHPTEFAPAERLRWVELLHDFHTAPLFAQATRSVYLLDEAEQSETQITRFTGIELKMGALDGWLGQRGWERVVDPLRRPSVAGPYLLRSFDYLGITAVLEVEDQWRDQKITGCEFRFGVTWEQVQKAGAIRLADVDPIAYSETVWPLSEISANPKYRA